MKMEGKRSVIEIQDDDGDFFSQVAAAEAAALASSKRRRITPSLNAGVRSPLANISKSKKEISAAQNDGLYMAALKGNQSIVREAAAAKGNDAVFGSAGGGGGNSCFKCGKSGHWARDCDSSAGGGGAGGNFGNSDPPMPEKSCPCGLGICTVLTANTEKNRGRKFYKCPLRQENGGCGFFEWCDNASAGNNYSMAGGNGNHTSDSSFPGLPCPCGAGLCLILTAKTGKNIGQQFYKCPANQGSSCGFFKWCNENTTSVSAPVSTLRAANNSSGTNNRSYGVRTGSSFYNTSDTNNTGYCVRTGSSFYNTSDTNNTGYNTSDTNNTGYGVRTGSSCFKCGKEGHWARDCSAPSLNPPAEMGGKSVSSGTCYKCGKPGHWSRDCSFA